MDGRLGNEVHSLINEVQTLGLFLGKFTILHSGHQYVIDTALNEVDKLIVLIYDAPSSTSIPLNIRSQWIKTIYSDSSLEVIEGWCAPEDVGYTDDVIMIQNEYIKKIVGNKKITHFYSSEPYGEHVSEALKCINRVVDIDRKKYPVSASVIQKNPYLYREFIHPVVYEDLIINIAFVGAPSTGKTTIAQHLSTIFKTNWMPEYGREYWNIHQTNRRLNSKQLVEIAEEHIIREQENLMNANQYLFTDTNAISTYMFALDYHDFAEERLIELANQAEYRYDLVFLCNDDIPYDDTWDRSGDQSRHQFQKKIISDLLQRKIAYITLSGTLDKRLEIVKNILSKFKKWESIGDILIHNITEE